jgi:hypothetical protein
MPATPSRSHAVARRAAHSYAPREHEQLETAQEIDLTLTRAACTGHFSEPEPPRLLERGSTGSLIIALGFSWLFSVLHGLL